MKQKGNHDNKKVLAGVIMLCLVLSLLITINTEQSMSHSLSIYSRQQEEKISLLFSIAEHNSERGQQTLKDELVKTLKKSIPTSASVYGFIAVNNRLTFIKDDTTTAKILEYDTVRLQEFLDIDLETVQNIQSGTNTLYSVLEDKRDYYVSIGSFQHNNDRYMIGICTREGYIIKKFKQHIYRLQLFIYIAIFVIVLIALTFFLLRKIREEQARILILEQDTVESRRLIDRLHDDLKEITNTNIKNQIYGFFPKQVVETILNNMTKEQHQKSAKLMVTIDSDIEEEVIFVSALLERMHVEKSISCMWSQKEFMVLILNATQKEAEKFTQIFSENYQSIYERQMDNIQFSIESKD